MRRFLFKVATSASAVVLVLSLGLWVATMVGNGVPAGRVQVSVMGTRYDGHTWRGKVVFDWDEIVLPPQRKVRGTQYHNFRQDPFAVDFVSAPSGIAPGFGVPWARHGTLAVPLGFVVLAAGFLPVLWVVWRRWGTSFPVGHCVHCGYDMRATPEKCPECGATAEGIPVR